MSDITDLVEFVMVQVKCPMVGFARWESLSSPKIVYSNNCFGIESKHYCRHCDDWVELTDIVWASPTASTKSAAGRELQFEHVTGNNARDVLTYSIEIREDDWPEFTRTVGDLDP